MGHTEVEENIQDVRVEEDFVNVNTDLVFLDAMVVVKETQTGHLGII